jgi:hypothetical protein
MSILDSQCIPPRASAQGARPPPGGLCFLAMGESEDGKVGRDATSRQDRDQIDSGMLLPLHSDRKRPSRPGGAAAGADVRAAFSPRPMGLIPEESTRCMST